MAHIATTSQVANKCPSPDSDPITTAHLDLRSDCRPLTRNIKHSCAANASNENWSNALSRQIRHMLVDTPASTGSVNSNSKPYSAGVSYQNIVNNTMLTPPSTPKSAALDLFSQALRALPTDTSRRRSSTVSSTSTSTSSIDIANLDLDTTHAQLLGTGLWSKVYKLTPFLPGPANPESPASSPPRFAVPSIAASALYTPPSTPQTKKPFPLPQAFAVKVATRKDAIPVFESEARILQHLHSDPQSQEHIVPFYGFSPKSSALIFDCCTSGTLDSLLLPSTPRSAEDSLQLFAELAPQLVAGLAYIHSKGVVHADIKPANILLSTSSTGTLNARFADFSASFLVDAEPPTGQFGGTWAFMAPELLSRDKELSTPTFKSDVYALGVTLLSLLISGDPFAEVAENMFMLREAVKIGDVISFALRQPGYERRINGVEKVWKEEGGEGSLVDLLKTALKKKKEERVEAGKWVDVLKQVGLLGRV